MQTVINKRTGLPAVPIPYTQATVTAVDPNGDEVTIVVPLPKPMTADDAKAFALGYVRAQGGDLSTAKLAPADKSADPADAQAFVVNDNGVDIESGKIEL